MILFQSWERRKTVWTELANNQNVCMIQIQHLNQICILQSKRLCFESTAEAIISSEDRLLVGAQQRNTWSKWNAVCKQHENSSPGQPSPGSGGEANNLLTWKLSVKPTNHLCECLCAISDSNWLPVFYCWRMLLVRAESTSFMFTRKPRNEHNSSTWHACHQRLTPKLEMSIKQFARSHISLMLESCEFSNGIWSRKGWIRH